MSKAKTVISAIALLAAGYGIKSFQTDHLNPQASAAKQQAFASNVDGVSSQTVTSQELSPRNNRAVQNQNTVAVEGARKIVKRPIVPEQFPTVAISSGEAAPEAPRMILDEIPADGATLNATSRRAPHRAVIARRTLDEIHADGDASDKRPIRREVASKLNFTTLAID